MGCLLGRIVSSRIAVTIVLAPIKYPILLGRNVSIDILLTLKEMHSVVSVHACFLDYAFSTCFRIFKAFLSLLSLTGAVDVRHVTPRRRCFAATCVVVISKLPQCNSATLVLDFKFLESICATHLNIMCICCSHFLDSYYLLRQCGEIIADLVGHFEYCHLDNVVLGYHRKGNKFVLNVWQIRTCRRNGSLLV